MAEINKYTYKDVLKLDLKSGPLNLLDHLVKLADDKGVVKINQPYLSKCIKTTRQTVSRYTKILEDTKVWDIPLIKVYRTRNKKTGKYNPHTYVINFLAKPKMFENNTYKKSKDYLADNLNEILKEYIDMEYEEESTNSQVHVKKYSKYNKKDMSVLLLNLRNFIKSLKLPASKVTPILATIVENLRDNRIKIFHPERFLKKCFQNYLKGNDIEKILEKFYYAFGFDEEKYKVYSINWDKLFQNM